MKKYILSFMILFSIFTLSSCVVDLTEGSVRIENRDSNRSSYITLVEYKSETDYGWHKCWSYNKYTTDSNIDFMINSGYYKFRVTVIYPNYFGYTDGYDTFETDVYSYYSEYSNYKFVFDGDRLIRRY